MVQRHYYSVARVFVVKPITHSAQKNKEVHSCILVWAIRSISAFISQDLLTHSNYMRTCIVMSLWPPQNTPPQSITAKSVMLEDAVENILLPEMPSVPFIFITCAYCEPALICETNRGPLAKFWCSLTNASWAACQSHLWASGAHGVCF